ncbi:hypothetical protein B566_EDAN001632 [Ephemera danica]|nr:hypothetical protein B566_EDAN001632 [Ephemera danica]
MGNWYSYQFTCLQVLEFLKSQDDTVGLLIKHLGTSAIMDLLLRLITGVEGVEMRSNVLTWLENQRVVQRIVELMGPGTEPERHCNAAQLLIDVIRVSRDNMRISAADRTEPDPILTRLESPETASQLLQLMLSGGEQRSESAIVGGVSVLLTLLDCSRPHNEESLILGGSLSEGCEEQQRTAHNTARAILPHLAELHDALLHPPKKNAVRTTAGVLDPPLGNTRLQVARLLVALIATQDMETHARLAELGTLNVLLDLFFHYRWNNFLHAQVEQCVALALRSLGGGDDGAAGTEAEGHNSQGSSPSSPPASMLPQSPPSVPEQTSTAAGTEQTAAGETSPQPEAMEEGKELVDTTVENAEVDTKDISPLVFNLFSDCRLLDRILDAWRSSDTEEGAKLQQKCGYYGHLVLMANSIADRVSDSMMERLVPDETTRVAWSEFSAGPLADINKVQSEYLGGQHPARMAAQESDDGDYQNIPFPQEDSVLQTFTELQTRYTTTPFVENFGYDDNQFFDGEDPMQLGSADEMERRAELFNQVCRQKMMMAADDEELEDQELTFQTAASSHSRPAHRARLSSDDSEEGEEEEERAGPEGREAPALTMEVDSTDPTVAMEIDCDNLETSTKKSIRKFESESGIPQKRPTLSHQKNTLQPNRIAIRMSTAKLEDACLEIVTINDQPFDYLEDSGFRKIIDPMIKALPEKPIISASQMPRKIHKKANEIRESIKTKFKGKLFSMKIDAVSRSDRIFIGVNLQEIADDKLNIVCLGVINSPVSHTALIKYTPSPLAMDAIS